VAARGRWEVELLPGARAGLIDILGEHGDDAFDQALNAILALEEDPTPEDAERLHLCPCLVAQRESDQGGSGSPLRTLIQGHADGYRQQDDKADKVEAPKTQTRAKDETQP